MYDKAVMYNPSKSAAEVQRLVEQPFIYLLAMARDTIEDKLMYIDDRLRDIEQLALPIPIDGFERPLTAIIPAFKGDNPEQEFEAGVNQGGHYKRSACDLRTSAYIDLTAAFSQKRLSVKDRLGIAKAGKSITAKHVLTKLCSLKNHTYSVWLMVIDHTLAYKVQLVSIEVFYPKLHIRVQHPATEHLANVLPAPNTPPPNLIWRLTPVYTALPAPLL